MPKPLGKPRADVALQYGTGRMAAWDFTVEEEVQEGPWNYLDDRLEFRPFNSLHLRSQWWDGQLAPSAPLGDRLPKQQLFFRSLVYGGEHAGVKSLAMAAAGRPLIRQLLTQLYSNQDQLRSFMHDWWRSRFG